MFGLNYAYQMPRKPETSPKPYKTGLQNKGGAKRGTKVKRLNGIQALVEELHGGDRIAAANAWGTSKSTLDKAISQGYVSRKLATQMVQGSNGKISFDLAMSLTKEKNALSQSDTKSPVSN